MRGKLSLFFALCYLLPAPCFGQVASRSDGVNVFYYDSLHEAFSVAVGVSIDSPDEITLLADFVLDEPLIIDDGVHIRFVADGSDRTIHRSPNLIGFPIFWVRGEGASLSLGKPDMGHELIIDGGYLNSTPIEAHSPLIALSGPDAKLIMYDKVALQNNINSGDAVTTSHYQNGAGVFIFTAGELIDRPAEFIMKGGTIRGNINNTQNAIPCGGGVAIHHVGIFTMEGGVIMNNTASHSGGGVYVYCRGSFRKTGGTIYGANAPAIYRNTTAIGLGTPPGYGHAVGVVANFGTLLRYRDDTVTESEKISYTGNAIGNGIFGRGEKWDSHDKAFRRMLLAIVLPVLVLTVGVILILRKRFLKILAKIVQEAADTAADIDIEDIDLSDREKDLCELLLTDRPLKEISTILGFSYSWVHSQTQKLYAKLGIENRTELLVRIKSEK